MIVYFLISYSSSSLLQAEIELHRAEECPERQTLNAFFHPHFKTINCCEVRERGMFGMMNV